jgi:hypothetical protein
MQLIIFHLLIFVSFEAQFGAEVEFGFEVGFEVEVQSFKTSQDNFTIILIDRKTM